MSLPGGRCAAPARGLLLVALGTISLLPFVALLVRSLAGAWFWPDLVPPRWTAEGWRELAAGGGPLVRAAATTIVLAAATGAGAAALGLVIGRALDGLRGGWRAIGAAAAFLPAAAPPIALAVGLQVSLLRLGLGASLPGVLAAHLVPAAGYTALFFLGVFAAWDPRVEAEARSLGATPRQAFVHVTLPLLRRPLVEAFALGFLVSWAQVPLTLLVGQGRVSTLPVAVLAYVAAGQDPLAATAAVLLAGPPLAMLAAAAYAIRRAGAVAA